MIKTKYRNARRKAAKARKRDQRTAAEIMAAVRLLSATPTHPGVDDVERSAEYTPTHPGVNDFQRSNYVNPMYHPQPIGITVEKRPKTTRPITRHELIEGHYKRKILELQPITGLKPIFLEEEHCAHGEEKRLSQERLSVAKLKWKYGVTDEGQQVQIVGNSQEGTSATASFVPMQPNVTNLQNLQGMQQQFMQSIAQQNKYDILRTYLNSVQRAWSTQDGSLVASFVSLKDEHVSNRSLQIKLPMVQMMKPLIGDIVDAHLKVLYHLTCEPKNYMAAYKNQTMCAKTVVKMLEQLKEANWCLPIMYVVCLDLRLLTERCEGVGNNSKPGEQLESAAECLMECFRVCAIDNRSPDDVTKRLGMLNLANQLLKIYFRIKKLNLCKPLMRAIDSSAYKGQFPLAQQITYKYFVGRMAAFDSEYESANEYLSFAFQHCPNKFPKNKRLILIYLVPVKMLLGYMPKKEVLENYDLLQFHEIASAIKDGNVGRFDEAMQRHKTFFIKHDIYLIVEKLKIIGYRNLFKKVQLLTQTRKLALQDLLCALKFVGETDISMDGTRCIVTNLINEKKINGHISQKRNKLVMSKRIPFPPLMS